jgi:hypothetical protein
LDEAGQNAGGADSGRADIVARPGPCSEVDEQRPRLGIGLACVDRGQRVIEPAEQEVVDGREEQQGVVALGRRLRDHVEHGVARGDGPADAVVERGVAAAPRVGGVEPDVRQRVVVAHASM